MLGLDLAVAQVPPTAATPASDSAYSIAPGPLTQVLRTIASTSGQTIVFDETEVDKYTSGAVSGSLTVQQAVTQALAGTGLVFGQKKTGEIAVYIMTLEKVSILAKRDQAETSFKADRSDTATRTGTSLMDVPGSITIITSKVLETQQSTNVVDALNNISGVNLQSSPQGLGSFSVRGFGGAGATVNGVGSQSGSITNIYGVERLEVLKGPQAILSGSGSLGGGINIVTKKPQADPLKSILLQYGSHGDLTVVGDATSALTDDKRLSYRLIASKTRASSSQGGFDGRDGESLLPQLRWKDAGTDLIVGLTYNKTHTPLPAYTFARQDGVILPVPSARLGNAGDGFDVKDSGVFYELEQKVTDNVTFISRFQRSLTTLRLHLWSPNGLDYDDGAAPDMPNGKVTFFGSPGVNKQRTTAIDNYFRIAVDTGPVGHKISIGFNETKSDLDMTQDNGAQVNQQLYPAQNVTFPDVYANASPGFVSENHYTDSGAFFQDLMSFGDWKLLINARRTKYKSGGSGIFFPDFTFSTTNPTQYHTTPGVGAIYSVTPEASVYASYSEGFIPQSQTSCSGATIQPLQTKNKELGAKFDLVANKLSVTAALFETAATGVAEFDPIRHCIFPVAGQKTRGVEVDLQGQILPGWDAAFNYTYSILKTDYPADPFSVASGIPKNKASVWTIYSFRGDTLAGWGVGGGINAQSSAKGSDFSPSLPGQARFDASVFYARDKWNFTFGLKNIFNRTLYGNSGSGAFVPVEDYRRFAITAKREFN